ncbi:Hypothetical protein NTJ_12519 [Nesidiocoris tenuis]|uniref:Peptidase S1 domain-containing protein n=1 Tax=Nesidiocoris tenuis TaxID=355587 RepID=A0ABN7B5N0_9HEMI|nr:Hypothetical protein NTJ_12519 [Nesidiocoris tenuis]
MPCIFFILIIGACTSSISAILKDPISMPPLIRAAGTSYDQIAFSGIRPRSIVVIEHEGKHPYIEGRTPYGWKKTCHGVLINFRVILAPCSCVSYAHPYSADEVNPWHHPKYEPNQQVADKGCCTKNVENKFAVYLLINQFVPRQSRVITGVTKFTCHPKANQYYLYDYAIINIPTIFDQSKLAWLHTGEFYTFKQNMDLMPLTSQSIGNCEVYQWTEHTTIEPTDDQSVAVSGGAFNWTRIYKKRTKYTLEKFEIKFTTWEKCKENYCPHTPWPAWVAGTYIYRRNNLYCNNEQTPRKYCMTWKENSPLCNITRGTPVFCDISNYQRGLVGYMVDKNTICPKTGFGVMLPLSYAIDFLASYIQIRQNPEYDRGIPKYIKDLRGLTLQ